MSHERTATGKKQSFKDSQTKIRFFIKKPRWKMKNNKGDMKNIKAAYKTTNLPE